MYEELSHFYDAMTADIDYDRVVRFLDRILRKSAAFRDYQRRGECPIVLDAACGTGSILKRLYACGYDCIGLDVSQEMLDAARENVNAEDVLWICQDMCRMDLFGTVAGICCMTDSVNHVTSEQALQNFFDRAHNFLDFGGVLIFDVLKEEHFTGNGGVLNCFADYEEASCFWSGHYYAKSGRCVYDISYFERQEDGRYVRTDDRVTERVWTDECLQAMLARANFGKVKVLEGCRLRLGNAAAHRLYYICEKERKIRE